MRMVVDTNYLGTEELRAYLSGSRKSVAVLTDQVEMEMVKARTPEGFLKSTEVLAPFARQVVLAKVSVPPPPYVGERKG